MRLHAKWHCREALEGKDRFRNVPSKFTLHNPADTSGCFPPSPNLSCTHSPTYSMSEVIEGVKEKKPCGSQSDISLLRTRWMSWCVWLFVCFWLIRTSRQPKLTLWSFFLLIYLKPFYKWSVNRSFKMLFKSKESAFYGLCLHRSTVGKKRFTSVQEYFELWVHPWQHIWSAAEILTHSSGAQLLYIDTQYESQTSDATRMKGSE